MTESTTKKDWALLLARRQKRLTYWREKFGEESAKGSTEGASWDDHFSTYSLLISKIVQSKDEDERKACDERLENIERELGSLFESRRLLTSEIGVAAVEE